MQNLCTYLSRIKHAGIDPTQKLCIYPEGNLICKNKSYTSQNSHTYPTGIEHASAVEEVEIEIETKVNSRQEPYQNR